MTVVRKLLSLAPLVILFLLLTSQSARAADITLSLGVGNSAISGYPGPYGTVGVTWIDATHALIELTALDQGGFHYLFGDGGMIGLNVNGAVTVQGGVGSVSFTQPNGTWNAPSISLGGAGNLDGFGSFNFSLNNGGGGGSGGYGGAVRSLSFTLVLSSGSWANASDVLTPNGSGYLAGGHVFVANSSYPNFSGTAPATGFAVNGSVPEPASVVTLGFAVLALGLVTRRLIS